MADWLLLFQSYARFNPDPNRAGELDWAILTSANLSKAAWGAFQKNGSQLMIRSYEMGVLLLPELLEKHSTSPNGAKLTVLGSQRCDSGADQIIPLPLPYEFPIRSYDPKKDEPWVWDLVRDSPDIYGNAYMPH